MCVIKFDYRYSSFERVVREELFEEVFVLRPKKIVMQIYGELKYRLSKHKLQRPNKRSPVILGVVEEDKTRRKTSEIIKARLYRPLQVD